MYERKSGGANLNGPDAADKMNILQVLCCNLSVEEMQDHQPVQAQIHLL